MSDGVGPAKGGAASPSRGLSGLFGFGKRSASSAAPAPKTKATQAHLGEDLSMYYNEELKQWVERGKEGEARASSALAPPPIPRSRQPSSENLDAASSSSGLRRSGSSGGSLSSRYVSTFATPAGGEGDVQGGATAAALLPRPPSGSGVGGAQQPQQPKVTLFMPRAPSGGAAQNAQQEGPTAGAPSDSDSASSLAQPPPRSSSASASAAFLSPRRRDSSSDALLLDDEDATAGMGGAAPRSSARRSAALQPSRGGEDMPQPKALRFEGGMGGEGDIPAPAENGQTAAPLEPLVAPSAAPQADDRLAPSDDEGDQGGMPAAMDPPPPAEAVEGGENAAGAAAVALSRWGPAPEGWDQAAFDAACDAAYAQGWVLNELGEWVAADWALQAQAQEQEQEQAQGASAAEELPAAPPTAADGSPAGDSLALAEPQASALPAAPPGDGGDQSQLLSSLREQLHELSASRDAALCDAERERLQAAERLRSETAQLSAETHRLSLLVTSLTADRDDWMARATAAEAASHAAFEAGRAAAASEADESVADLLILLGQEGRRVEALREALEAVGVDSSKVLHALQAQEDQEMMASMGGGAEHPPDGGAPGGCGDGGDGVVTAAAAVEAPPAPPAVVAAPAAPAAPPASQQQTMWRTASGVTPFARGQEEDEDEMALLASLPAPGKGLPTAPLLRVALPVPAHAHASGV